MIKQNKLKLITSSAIILLPILFGLIMWNKLPEYMPSHWGIDGKVDGMSGRGFAVFALPLMMLAVHWFCIFFTAKDPKNKDQNGKVFGLIFWIIPVISLAINGMLYSVAFGKELSPFMFVGLLLGVIFTAIGNFLPKCKQNYTIGIKVKWALENEENWNATHRFGGKVWFISGILLIISVFLPLPAAAIPAVFFILIAVALIPMVYSYAYHRKQVREGTAVITPVQISKSGKAAVTGSLIATAVVLILVGVLMFTGSVELSYGDNAFTVNASMWNDLTVEYDAIDAIEYRDTDEPGSKTAGFNSAKLLAGAFHNDEFGAYTRYSYTGCPACVVLTVNEKNLVISGEDAESTKAIYETLLEKRSDLR